MKNLSRLTLLIILSLVLSCLKSPNNGNTGVTSLDLENSLPNGRWQGTGTVTSSINADAPSELTLTIENNEITEDFFTQGKSGIAIHSLNYTERGHAEWRDQNGKVTGSCQCFTKTCHCFSEDNAGNRHQMTLSFTERELNLEQSGEVSRVKYHNTYKLRMN